MPNRILQLAPIGFVVGFQWSFHDYWIFMARLVIERDGTVSRIPDHGEACSGQKFVRELREPTAQEIAEWARIQEQIISEYAGGAASGTRWRADGAWLEVDWRGRRSFKIPENARLAHLESERIKAAEMWQRDQALIMDQIRAGADSGIGWRLENLTVHVNGRGAFPITEELAALIWQREQERIADEIRAGATSGIGWYLENLTVHVSGKGEFSIEFDLPRINDDRIARYMRAHDVSVSPEEVREIRKRVFELSDSEAKCELKSIILAIKRRDAALDRKLQSGD